MELKDRVVVVTGAASGLGAATARMCVEAGARIVLADMNRDEGEALAGELGPAARFVPVDVTDEAQASGVIETALAEFGAVHALVNCAGIAPAEKVIGKNGPHRLDVFAKVIGVNLIGTFNMIRLAAAAMSRNDPGTGEERGVIVNTASVAAFDGQIGQAAYAASKSGVVGMTLPLARELGRSAIRVNTIAPGIMETPMLTAMPAEVQASLAAMIPFPPRLGRPREFANLVRHVVENGYLNGEVIRLDGAVRMNAR